MQQYKTLGFSLPSPAVKILLIINVLLFLTAFALNSFINLDLVRLLGLYYPTSENFRAWQIVTYMFMYGGLQHILINMLVLWIFGNVLENVWGAKRFLIYYLATGIGAGLVHILLIYIKITYIIPDLTDEQISLVYSEGFNILQSGMNYQDPSMGQLNLLLNTPIVGAYGAIFGILLAVGMVFSNTQLMLIFPPIPIKGKYITIATLLYAVFVSFQSQESQFAHFGGLAAGLMMILLWKRKADS